MQDIKPKSQNNSLAEPQIKRGRLGFLKFIFLSLCIMLLGAFGAVLVDRALFPYLAEMKLFDRYDFLKRAVERTTIINKTEQVVMSGDFAGSKVFEDNKLASIKIFMKNFGNGSGTENTETFFSNGFAATQDGIVFGRGVASLSGLINPQKFSITFGNSSAREFELLKESDEDISIFKCSGDQCSSDRLDINVLPFEENVKIGEEIFIVSQDSMLSAFIKSKSPNKILLNDYPDANLDGGIGLNKEGKIVGMYRVKKENGILISYLVPAEMLQNKIEEIFKK